MFFTDNTPNPPHQPLPTCPSGIDVDGGVGNGPDGGGISTPVSPPPTFDGTVDTGGSTVLIGPGGTGSGAAVSDGCSEVDDTTTLGAGGIVGEAGGSSHFPALSTIGGSQMSTVVELPGTVVDVTTVVVVPPP